MASKKLSSDTSLANSYKLSRGLASVARPSAPTIGTATNTSFGLMSVTFTPSVLGPTASSYTLTSSSGITGSGASSPITLQESTEGTYTYTVYGTNANGNGPLSSASSSVTVDSIDPASYFPITTTTLASATASVTFSSIPSTYTHLQIRFLARTARANQEDNIQLRFNSDSGSNYAAHVLYGDGASAGAFSDGTSISFNTRSVVAAASSASGVFGSGVIDILDYANTSKNTTVRSLSGYDANGSGQARLSSGLWMNTAAVTSVTIVSANAANLSAYSSFTLYGIKG